MGCWVRHQGELHAINQDCFWLRCQMESASFHDGQIKCITECLNENLVVVVPGNSNDCSSRLQKRQKNSFYFTNRRLNLGWTISIIEEIPSNDHDIHIISFQVTINLLKRLNNLLTSVDPSEIVTHMPIGCM